jgi:hypothetical protein
MRRPLTRTFWIEAVLAAASAGSLALTLLWHDWIEIIFGIEPDNSSGSLEWIIVVACLFVAIVFALLARQEWRRTARSQWRSLP